MNVEVYHACVSGRKESLVVVRVNEKNNKKECICIHRGMEQEGWREKSFVGGIHKALGGRMDGWSRRGRSGVRKTNECA